MVTVKQETKEETKQETKQETSNAETGNMSGKSQLQLQLKSILYFLGAIYLLHAMDVYENIFHSPHVNRFWFNLTLSSAIGLLGVKSYAEIYEGKVKKSKVTYENFRQTTHVVIFLFLFTSICLHVALWPVYGARTFIVTIAIGYGLTLQILLELPVIAQNLIGAMFLMFVTQKYNNYV